EQFDEWGWRVPFLISILMVVVSYVIRRKMHESPVFAKAKAEGKTTTNPLKESFGNKYNLKFVLLALFGAAMGQGVVWYTGQFYAMSFLKTVMFVESSQVDGLLGIALLLATPFFIFFGWLSDKVGRKPIMMLGMLLAIFLYRPIYTAMYKTTDTALKTEVAEKSTTEAIIKEAKEGKLDSIYTYNKVFTDGTQFTQIKTVHLENGQPIMVDGKAKADTKTTLVVPESDRWWLIFLVFIQVIFVTMVYGPIAAFLVEMFPVKIRYTSMSLPYHVGNGIFGGLLPAISTYFVTTAKEVKNPEFYLRFIPSSIQQNNSRFVQQQM
ncbi:MAG: MFS transporter, partial [Sphingobacteriales bacterium]